MIVQVGQKVYVNMSKVSLCGVVELNVVIFVNLLLIKLLFFQCFVNL